MDVAVLGATSPGPEVAQLCARAGHDVSLYDEDANTVMDAVDTIEGRLPADDGDTVTRISATTGFDAVISGATAVVETATAETAPLQERFAAVEAVADNETLIATSATGVPVTAAAAGLRHPGRAVGLQFRDPLTTELVEVAVAEQTTRETADRVQSFVDSLDRTPVVIRDTPGGVSMRAELALEAEAMRLVTADVAGVRAIDEALTLGYDHPVGPLETADRAGLDDRLRALESLQADLGSRFAPPAVLTELVAAGKTGRPSGTGFYVWEGGEPVEPARPTPEIPHRDDAPEDPALE